MIRGLSCELKNADIIPVISSLMQDDCCFYVSWCLKTDSLHPGIPEPYTDFYVDKDKLNKLDDGCIWEIVLQVYPKGISHGQLISYEDFVASQCEVCLIYYDCWFLDVYIKNPDLQTKLWDYLTEIETDNLEWITDENDGRTKLATH